MSATAEPSVPVCLIIAGYDPSGGGGVLADLRAARACGARAVAAVTAVTAQNTTDLTCMEPVAPELLRAQLDLLLAEFPVGAVKLGMLATAANAAVVLDALRRLPGELPVVLDPVLAATAGGPLFEPDRLDALRALLPRVTLVTPNLPELAALTGIPTDTREDRRDGALALLAAGARAVLVKGGHGEGDQVMDELFTAEGVTEFAHPRLALPKIRGTGCFLATAIACCLLGRRPLPDAVAEARALLLARLGAAWFPAGGNGLLPDVI